MKTMNVGIPKAITGTPDFELRDRVVVAVDVEFEDQGLSMTLEFFVLKAGVVSKQVEVKNGGREQ